MSVLTKNWFTLTASFPILNFCIHTFYKVIKSSGIPFDTDKDKREAFFKYVEYTISRFSEQNVSVHTVKLYTGGFQDATKEDITDRCLRLFKKGIKVLEISAATWPIYVEQPMYRLPDILLSAASLTSLTLCACELPSSLKVDAIKFKSLKCLHLDSILLDEEMIKRLTMSCPLLEQLLIYCHGFKTFYIHGLHYLQILFLKFKDEVEKINIEASNLCFLGLLDDDGGVAPSMNFASCKKLTRNLNQFSSPQIP
ncbi:F-box domain containing protein [Tanacetum coccineum]